MIKKLAQSKIIRYGVVAAIATGVDVTFYFLTFNYILRKEDFRVINEFVLTAPTISLAISYSCGLLTNFFLTRNYVFTESDLRGRHQLMRYVMVALLILFLNYVMMSFLIRGLEWYPTISRGISAVSVGFVSFAIHRAFSFRVSGEKPGDDI